MPPCGYSGLVGWGTAFADFDHDGDQDLVFVGYGPNNLGKLYENMTDPVDEWVVQSLDEYKGKKLKSAEKGDLDLEKSEDKEAGEYADLFESIKGNLDDNIKEVKPSTRLKESVACLSEDAYEMSAYMEKILKAT